MTQREHTEKFKITRRPGWSHLPTIEVEITCEPSATFGVKLGLAVRVALKSRADLSGADLSGANLSRANLSWADLSGANLSWADLSGANLSWADLSGANLSRANLSRANLSRADLSRADLSRANLSGANLSRANLSEDDLRPFKADLWLTLSEIGGAAEAQDLIAKLRAGKVNGSTYGAANECACLVGTIANAKGVDYGTLSHDSGRPAERWFMMIKPGDVPSPETGGGFAALKALEWTEQWCAAHGHPLVASKAKRARPSRATRQDGGGA